MFSFKLAEAYVELGTKGGLTKGFAQARTETRGFLSGMGAIKGALAGAFALFAGNKISEWIRDAADETDEMAKAARRLGEPVQDIAALGYAAKLANVDVRQLYMAMKEGQLALANSAEDPKSKASQLLKRFDIDPKNSGGMIAMLEKLADATKDLPNVQRTLVMAELFGSRAGPMLLQLFEEGSKGFKQMIAEAKELDLLPTKRQVQIAEELHDAYDRLGAVWSSSKRKFLEVFGPNQIAMLNQLAHVLPVIMVEVGGIAAAAATLGSGLVSLFTNTNVGLTSNANSWRQVKHEIQDVRDWTIAWGGVVIAILGTIPEALNLTFENMKAAAKNFWSDFVASADWAIRSVRKMGGNLVGGDGWIAKSVDWILQSKGAAMAVGLGLFGNVRGAELGGAGILNLAEIMRHNTPNGGFVGNDNFYPPDRNHPDQVAAQGVYDTAWKAMLEKLTKVFNPPERKPEADLRPNNPDFVDLFKDTLHKTAGMKEVGQFNGVLDAWKTVQSQIVKGQQTVEEEQLSTLKDIKGLVKPISDAAKGGSLSPNLIGN